jgi:hypothetical protein
VGAAAKMLHVKARPIFADGRYIWAPKQPLVTSPKQPQGKAMPGQARPGARKMSTHARRLSLLA